MVFEYRNEQKDGKLLQPQDVYNYLEYGMKILALRQPPELNPNYHKIYQFWGYIVKGIVAVYTPIAFALPFWKGFDTMTPNEIVGILVILFNVPAISMKLIILLINASRIDKAKKLLADMYKRCFSHEERLQVHVFTSRCHVVTYLYVTMYIMVPTLKFLSSVLSGYSPFNLYNPFIDWRESTKNLWITSTFDYLILFPPNFCNIIVDSMPFIFGLTVREHLKLLIKRVQKLRKNVDVKEQQHYEELVLCIKDHKLILEYCDLMRPYVSRSLFVQFTAMALVLALTLIHLMFFANFFTGLSTIWYLTACIMQSFPICLTCDLIIEDCNDLAMAIFHSNWNSAEKRYKMTLIYFTQSAQKPIRFIGGGVLPICLATYSQMVKLAFSLITFIKQMNIFEEVQ